MGRATLARLEHGPGVILFGQHTDLMEHREARAAGLGSVVARSMLIFSRGGAPLEQRCRSNPRLSAGSTLRPAPLEA